MSTDNSPILQLRDAKAMARHLIEHHFGEKPRRILHKSSGLSNFVFIVEQAKEKYLVRLHPSPTKITTYMKEQWAISEARKVGVPVPEILQVGNEVVPYPYMISREVRGIEATYHPDRLQIIYEMGRYAALINSIATTGFGDTFDWSNNQLSKNDTWIEFLEKELQLETRLKIFEKNRIYSPLQLKKLNLILKNKKGSNLKPVLTHGDLRLKNIIVDDKGKIIAIVDWEDCLSSLAPYWELSIALHDLSIDEKQKFLQGYDLSVKKMASTALLIKAINIINYAPKIECLSNEKDKEQLDLHRIRLQGAFDLYSL